MEPREEREEIRDLGRDQERRIRDLGEHEERDLRGMSSDLRSRLNNFKNKGINHVKNAHGHLKNHVRNATSSQAQSKYVNFIKKLFLFLIVLGVLWFFLGNLGTIFISAIILGFVVLVFRSDYARKNPIIKFILGLALVAGFIVFFAPTLLADTGILSAENYQSITEGFAKSTMRIVEGAGSWDPFGSFSGFWEKQVAIASGGYFQGQVEENKGDQRLGIYINKIESSRPVLRTGEKAVFWATIEGKALENEFELTVDCNASEGNEHKTSRAQTFEIYTAEEREVDCIFSELPEGSIKIEYNVDYDFTTLGYQKGYFIDLERARSLRKQGIDPLTHYDIADKNPLSIYTDGPVTIGIDLGRQPVTISSQNERMAVLGVTIENKWDGKVKNLKHLEIQVPGSMSLSDCDHEFEETSSAKCRQRCGDSTECKDDCALYTFYELSAGEIAKIQDLEKYHTFKCALHPEIRSDIFRDSPLSTRYIRVLTDYEYRAQKDKIFVVRDE